MSWMSPLTVPITILPIGSAPVSASSGRRISMPAFIAFAASSTSGHEQDAVAEVDADDAHAFDERVVQHAIGAQLRPRRMFVASMISSRRPL